MHLVATWTKLLGTGIQTNMEGESFCVSTCISHIHLSTSGCVPILIYEKSFETECNNYNVDFAG